MATFDNYKRPSQKTTTTSLKSRILKSLPKGFKCAVSKTGLAVRIWVDTNKVGGCDRANQLVYTLAEKLKLSEVYSETPMSMLVREWELDWEFINTTVENKMVAEAKDILKTMKSFFKKYGNSYCESDTCYRVINKIHTLIANAEC